MEVPDGLALKSTVSPILIAGSFTLVSFASLIIFVVGTGDKKVAPSGITIQILLRPSSPTVSRISCIVKISLPLFALLDPKSEVTVDEVNV